MTNVTIPLPDDLAKQAQQAGLLVPAVVEAWLQERLRAQDQEKFFALIERMANDSAPAMTSSALQSEIRAARQQLKPLLNR